MDNEEIDIAAAMGFSAFGGNKKRKHDLTRSPKATTDASGANSTQLGVRSKKLALEDTTETGDPSVLAPIDSTHEHHQSKSDKANRTGGLADYLARAQTLSQRPANIATNTGGVTEDSEHAATEMLSFGGLAISKAELNALRFGIKGENGDTAYFLPNFVEDPWAKFQGRGE